MSLAKAVGYRVRQFMRALTARQAISSRRIERAADVLSPQALALFLEQAPQDQCHALDVYETLLRAGHRDRDLLAAGLLHDVGKAATQMPAWRRALRVLAERMAPWAMRQSAGDKNRLPRRTGSLYAKHPETGARRAREVECSELTIALIGQHETDPKTCCEELRPYLAALQAADNTN